MYGEERVDYRWPVHQRLGGGAGAVSRRVLFARLPLAVAVAALAGCGGAAIRPSPLSNARHPDQAFPGPSHMGALSSPVPRVVIPSIAVPTPTPSPSPTPAPRTISLWTTRSDSAWIAALREAIGVFRATRPYLTVEVTGGRDDFGDIVAGLGTGNGPDAIEPGDLVPFAARGLLKPLDTLLSPATVSSANYLPAMWENGRWQGTTYGIPALDHGPELGLVWNTSLTATATAPRTWDELYLFGQRLTRQDASGAIQSLGFDPLDGVGGLLDTARDVTGAPWFDAANGRVTLASAPYEEYLQGIATFYSKIGTDRIISFRQTHHLLTSSRQGAINEGKQVALLDGYWSVAEIARFAADASWRFEFTWVPSSPPGTTIQRIGGRVLGIPSAARYPDAAWELVVFLAGDTTNRLLCVRIGTCAMTRSFLASGAWSVHPGLAFYVDSLRSAARLVSRGSNAVTGYAQAKWAQAITGVLTGRLSIKDALTAAQNAIQVAAGRARV